MEMNGTKKLVLITIHLTLFNFMNTHEFLIEIYNDFCIKNNLPRGKADHRDNLIGGAFLSAEDYLNSTMRLTHCQKRWLYAYINLWEATNGGEDI